MIFHKKTRERRKKFLIDSNQKIFRKTKKIRNALLNFLAKILFFRQIGKIFRMSFFVGMIFLGMTGFIIFAIFSPYFHLKKITLVRNSPNIDLPEIEKSLNNFYDQNLLFISHEDIKQKLFTDFPEFREIQITENWPSALEFTIKISPALFNLLNIETANFSVISKDGIILAEKSNEKLLTIKVSQYKKNIQPRQKFLEKEFLLKILHSKQLLESLKLKIKEFHLLYFAKELHVVLENNSVIWIDLQLPIEPQVEKLKFSESRIKLYDKIFEHIDLRIPNEIFWEYK